MTDLTEGKDIRDDWALFIEEIHFIGDGWEIDEEAKSVTSNGTHFFRVIKDGEQQRGHGWIEDGKIVQWG